MDGVLCDWVKGYESLENMPSLEELNNMPKTKKNKLKKTFYTYDFFKNLEPIVKGFRLLANLIDNGDEVCICTATGTINTEEVKRAKLDWVREYIGNVEVKFVDKVEQKSVHIEGDYIHILIDDRQKAIDAWEKHSNSAIGVLFV